MNSEQQNQAEAVRIIHRLGKGNASEQVRAIQELEQRDLNTVSGLIGLLNAERARWRERGRMLRYIKYVGIYVVGLNQILQMGRLAFFDLLGVWILLWLFEMMLLADKQRSLQRGMAIALAKFDDLALLPPLIDLKSESNHDLIAPVLIRLLPRLQANDAALFKENQRTRLYRELERCNGHLALDAGNVKYVTAILKALEQVGDDEAVPYVKKLAHKALNEHVRHAARDCLTFLQARADRSRAASTLLRSSSAESSSGELLRAASAGAGNEPYQLLRATNSTEAD